jgi:hypothetical protein
MQEMRSLKLGEKKTQAHSGNKNNQKTASRELHMREKEKMQESIDFTLGRVRWIQRPGEPVRPFLIELQCVPGCDSTTFYQSDKRKAEKQVAIPTCKNY